MSFSKTVIFDLRQPTSQVLAARKILSRTGKRDTAQQKGMSALGQKRA
jgi:hypothetical protein